MALRRVIRVVEDEPPLLSFNWWRAGTSRVHVPRDEFVGYFLRVGAFEIPFCEFFEVVGVFDAHQGVVFSDNAVQDREPPAYLLGEEHPVLIARAVREDNRLLPFVKTLSEEVLDAY